MLLRDPLYHARCDLPHRDPRMIDFFLMMQSYHAPLDRATPNRDFFSIKLFPKKPPLILDLPPPLAYDCIMTNNEIIIPTDSTDCAIILRDTLIAASHSIIDASSRITDPILNPYRLLSDNDDYTPAAARIIAAITASTFDSIHDNARDAIIFLLADDDFTADMLTCDFDSPMHNLIPDPFDD